MSIKMGTVNIVEIAEYLHRNNIRSIEILDAHRQHSGENTIAFVVTERFGSQSTWNPVNLDPNDTQC